MTARVIAQRGPNDFLVSESGDMTYGKGNIVHLPDEMVYPSLPIQSILARGYWDDVSADEKVLKKVLKIYENKKES